MAALVILMTAVLALTVAVATNRPVTRGACGDPEESLGRKVRSSADESDLRLSKKVGHGDPEDVGETAKRRHSRVRRADFFFAPGSPARFDELQLILGNARLIGEGFLGQTAVVPQPAKSFAEATRAVLIPHSIHDLLRASENTPYVNGLL